MGEFIQIVTSMPVVPFTVLLGCCSLYWLTVIAGAVDVELFDVDMDIDFPDEPSLADWGMVGLKWFNLGDVPLAVWASVFTASGWLAANVFDRDLALTGGTNSDLWLAILRDGAIGVFGAKVLTQPLKGRLKHREPNTIALLLGQHVVITSTEVTPEFGTAEYPTSEGAPLKLNVRVASGRLERGQTAQIVNYTGATDLYEVQAINGDPRT
ncbi:MAG: hypothetical protein KDA58_12355 [Planctomycetaceae bacterium]|nr:hypothetical protein [Planctomycetaceae bacterium]